MATIPSIFIKICEAVWLRLTMAILFYLSLEFGRMFISAGAVDHPYLTVSAGLFFEITGVIIFDLLYSSEHIGRDVNTLNFYSVVTYLIYLALYFRGIDASELHNYAAKCINGLIGLRLFYFGARDILAPIAFIGGIKKSLLTNRLYINRYFNGLTACLFFFCAAPLFTLIYLINTDKMRITGIAIILFVFFIAIEYAHKQRLIRAAQMNQRGATGKPITAATRARVLKKIRAAGREVRQLRGLNKFLIGSATLILGGLFLGAANTIEKTRIFSYAAGYVDAKTGKPPKTETNIEKMLDCYHSRMNSPAPSPPGGECDKYMKFKE